MLTELCSFQWVANPVNDMYADAVLAVILQVESNPTTAQGLFKFLILLRQPAMTRSVSFMKSMAVTFT